MMTKKHILAFDFDGTLADSMKLEHKSMLYAIHLFGHEDITDDNLENYYGPTESGIIRRIVGEENFEKIYPLFLKKYTEFQKDCLTPIPGLKELLASLSENKDLTLILVTGRSLDTLKISLSYLGYDKYFKKLYAGSETGINKGESMDKARAELKVEKKDMLYIGDTLADIHTMKDYNYDLISVGYCYGSSYQEELRKGNPGWVATSVKELETLLKKVI